MGGKLLYRFHNRIFVFHLCFAGVWSRFLASVPVFGICVAGEIIHPQDPFQPPYTFFLFFRNVKVLLISSLHQNMKFNLGNCLRCYLILVVDFMYLLPFYSLSSERKQLHFHNAPLLSTTFDEFQRSLAPLQIFEEKTRSQSQDLRHESSQAE